MHDCTIREEVFVHCIELNSYHILTQSHIQPIVSQTINEPHLTIYRPRCYALHAACRSVFVKAAASIPSKGVPAVPVLSLLRVNPAFSSVVASPTAGASPLLPAG